MKIILSNEKARGFLEPAGQLEAINLEDHLDDHHETKRNQHDGSAKLEQTGYFFNPPNKIRS